MKTLIPWILILVAITLASQVFAATHSTLDDPPGEFERVAPADTFLGLIGMGVECSWTASQDPDNDSIRYIFHLQSQPEGWPVHPADTVTALTHQFVIIAVPTIPTDEIVSFRWTVRATDGIDTVEATNGEGRFTAEIETRAGDKSAPLIKEFALSVCPNPFNSTAILSYDLPQAGPVELKVFNLVGEVVQVLHQGYHTPGRYRAEWNALSEPSGTYFVVLKAESQTKIQKLLLLK